MFEGNEAITHGGALLCVNVKDIFLDSDSFIVNNKALIGGGIRFLYD